MKKIIIILMLFFITFLSSCQINKPYTNNYMYFGTTITITLYGKEKAINKEFEYTKDFLKKYSDLSDRYYEFQGINNIYKINNSDGETIKIEKELFNLIKYAVNNSRILKDDKNNSYFNIGIGSLVDVYKDYYINDIINEFPKITSILNTDINDLILDEENMTVALKNGLKLDLGGISKGYAVNELKEYYDSKSLKYIINAGQSTIITNYGNPERKNNNYLVGLINPNYIIDNTKNNIYGILNVPFDKAITTSGDYQKYFIYNDKLYGHILDYRTNEPVKTDIRSITIITDNSALGDILSTSLFMIGSDKAVEYLNELNIDGIMFLDDGSILSTENIKQYITLENEFSYKI